MTHLLIPDYLEMVNDIENVAGFISDRREPYSEQEEWDYMKDKLDNDAIPTPDQSLQISCERLHTRKVFG